jgi:hypothetical protein
MKLNGFENYIITEAVNYYKETAEEEIEKLEKSGKRSMIAPGYYTQVCKDLLYKIDRLTLASYIKERNKENK